MSEAQKEQLKWHLARLWMDGDVGPERLRTILSDILEALVGGDE